MELGFFVLIYIDTVRLSTAPFFLTVRNYYKQTLFLTDKDFNYN